MSIIKGKKMISLLDTIYSKLANRDLFFQSGWGDKEGLYYLLANHPTEIHLRPVRDIEVIWKSEIKEKDFIIKEGSFKSPFVFEYKLGRECKIIELPEEAKQAYVQMILPKDHNSNTPLAIHFAATGDEGFTRRRISMAIPLIQKGIGSVLLENPFYGRRRPKDQKGVVLKTFTEFLRMSRATTDEGIALLRYLRKEGYSNLGVTGISMGGYVAITAAARSELELAVAACIPSHSGSPVYIDGALSRACDWKSLQSDSPNKNDARHFMRLILDRADIRSFPKPKRPDAMIIVGAQNDGYIPNYSTKIIKNHWSESTIRWVSTGHVGSFLFCLGDFRKAVVDSFRLLGNSSQ